MSKSSLFISIIIPTLNEEICLPRLLEDILCQTYTNFELIIVDGTSKDKTLSIARKYYKRFTSKGISSLVLQEKYPGTSRQRNAGAAKARGDYLVFLDADVRISVDWLAILKEQLVNTHAKFVTTKVKTNSKNIFDKGIVSGLNTATYLLCFTPFVFVIGFNTIIKSEFFKKLDGYDEKIHYGEDHDLSMRAQKNSIAISYFNKPVLTMSMRRYHKYGRMKTVLNYLQTFVHEALIGPDKKSSLEYPMGGKHE